MYLYIDQYRYINSTPSKRSVIVRTQITGTGGGDLFAKTSACTCYLSSSPFLFLPQKYFQQQILPPTIRLITNRQIQPGIFFYYASAVAEQLKALTAMIASHATSAHSAKAHITCCQVNNCIVDTSAAKAAKLQNPALCFFTPCKQIERKRFFPLRHIRDNL